VATALAQDLGPRI